MYQVSGPSVLPWVSYSFLSRRRGAGAGGKVPKGSGRVLSIWRNKRNKTKRSDRGDPLGVRFFTTFLFIKSSRARFYSPIITFAFAFASSLIISYWLLSSLFFNMNIHVPPRFKIHPFQTLKSDFQPGSIKVFFYEAGTTKVQSMVRVASFDHSSRNIQ